MKRRNGWRKQSEKHMNRNRLEQEKENGKIEKSSNSGIFEICVSCGKQTDIPREKHISERRFYIEGAGQLCRDCYYQLYGPGRFEK